MRTLLAILLAASLLAGCTDPSPEPRAETPPEPALRAETVRIAFGAPAAVSLGGPAHVSHLEPFTVPERVARLTAEAEWSCVSLCPLEAWLVTPSEQAVGAVAGGSGLTIEVVDPVPGAWGFEWTARDDASVGVDGTLVLTLESPAPAAAAAAK
jgi:hypothetical protein